jgi:hypothetical protein
MAEASDRPLYSSLNLRKVAGGNDIFGPIGMVWRPTTMATRTMLAPVDTGCYEYLCNTTWITQLCTSFRSEELCAAAWTGLECSWSNATQTCRPDVRLAAANCSQWADPSAFPGTPQHFDHLIIPAAHWWNGR